MNGVGGKEVVAKLGFWCEGYCLVHIALRFALAANAPILAISLRRFLLSFFARSMPPCELNSIRASASCLGVRVISYFTSL